MLVSLNPVERLWYQFGQQLSEYICRKTGHQDHCHDILQEVYIRIIQNIDKVEQADNIGAYLFRLASNAVNDYHRKANPYKVFIDSSNLDIADTFITDCHPVNSAVSLIKNNCATPAAQDSPAIDPRPSDSTQGLASGSLRSMIESLPPIYRDALIWTQLEGVSQKDLAQKLGISETGARSRVQRAREKLKQVILNCCAYEFDKYGNILSCHYSARIKK